MYVTNAKMFLKRDVELQKRKKSILVTYDLLYQCVNIRVKYEQSIKYYLFIFAYLTWTRDKSTIR